MKGKLANLEKAEERRQKEERRNNVVISGFASGGEKELNLKVEAFCKEELNVDSTVKTAFKIAEDKVGMEIVVAKMGSREDKEKVIKSKSFLKALKEEIYINHNLTKAEAQAQMEKRKNMKSGQGDRTRLYQSWIVKASDESETDVATERTKVIFWNVAGAGRKDRDFWEYISSFHIVCLVESWIEQNQWNSLLARLPTGYSWKFCPAKRENQKG